MFGVEMARIKTGIPGLDELLGGGFLEGAQVLLAGGCGTGKTIFGLQYLYKGAADYEEPGVLIMLEESPLNVWWNMRSFGWDLTDMEEKGLLKIYRFTRYSPEVFQQKFDEEIAKVKKIVEEIGAKRLVIDSISTFGVWMQELWRIRYNLFKLIDVLRGLNVTSLLITETKEGDKHALSTFGVEEYVADGVIKLILKPPNRIMYIRKMRGLKHDMRPHPYQITDEGIVINPHEEVLWEAIGD